MAGYKNWPVFLKVAFYLTVNYLLIAITQILLGFLHIQAPIVFNTVLCILLLLFTFFVLRLENRSFQFTGLVVKSAPGIQFLTVGFAIGTIMLLATTFTVKKLTGFTWVKNDVFDIRMASLTFITTLISVFVQEVAFRGYPFRILLEKWGVWTAQLIIAILFGFMHLHENMSLTEALLTMLTTGAGSLLFGMTVIKTGHLHMAIGIHFGWNFFQAMLPRHPSQNGGGIVLISDGQIETNPIIWVVPYLVIVAAVYFILLYSLMRPHRIKHELPN